LSSCPLVLDLGSQPIEDKRSVLEVKSAIGKGPIALGRVTADARAVFVYTLMSVGKPCKQVLDTRAGFST
jgi:hypothetical protein